VVWAAVNLAGNGVTGTLGIANGGTGGNNATAAFNALTPQTSLGDIIAYNNGSVRLGAGANGTVLTANSANSTGLTWVAPATTVTKYTVSFNNSSFTANAAAVDVTLFTLNSNQKITGITAQAPNLFLNANNTMTDVSVSVGVGGNAIFFSGNFSIGNNGNTGNFQDTALWKSNNMTANQSVLAHFIAAVINFGNGANTNLLGGNVNIWVSTTTLP
jgi:hypothetical protein